VTSRLGAQLSRASGGAWESAAYKLANLFGRFHLLIRVNLDENSPTPCQEFAEIYAALPGSPSQ